VLAQARAISRLRLFSPDRTCVDVPGELACGPRVTLDRVLQQAACDAGARFMAPMRLTQVSRSDGAIAGATFEHVRTTERTEVTARFTVLATGAASQPLELYGVCERKAPSGVAARVYARVPPSLWREIDYLCVSFDEQIRPGYGWVFPMPDGHVNMGVGYFHGGDVRHKSQNVRDLWNGFAGSFPLARRLLDQALSVSELQGAPLRTALTGAKLSRPGVLVIGEAAGMTYSGSGEGIGKALESGILAAECIHAHFSSRNGHAEDTYESTIRGRFEARFRAYLRMQSWLDQPWLCNLLARRAKENAFVIAEVRGVLAETTDPARLFSLPGLFKAVL
jgi:flavin-dependent dehydrogenase